MILEYRLNINKVFQSLKDRNSECKDIVYTNMILYF